jgi:hypothetical protein
VERDAAALANGGLILGGNQRSVDLHAVFHTTSNCGEQPHVQFGGKYFRRRVAERESLSSPRIPLIRYNLDIKIHLVNEVSRLCINVTAPGDSRHRSADDENGLTQKLETHSVDA